MITTSNPQDLINQSIDENRALYIQTSQDIHANPEIGNEEFYASTKHITLLEQTGFEVTTAVAGHETAFYAEKDSGKEGPTIAYLAEYDALPGIGHACGHNMIGTISIAAGIALAQMLPETGGRVVILGTPAEEGGSNGSAKGSFVRHGYLDEVDVALMIHPSGKTAITRDSLAVDPLEFHFYGKSAHASSSPHLGINALDAVLQLFSGVNALRQQLSSDARIHGIITHGGDAPNMIPEYAAARFYIRAASWQKTIELSDKVRNIAEAAALTTGAIVTIERFQNEVKDLLLNPVLDNVLAEELSALGEAVHTEKQESIGSTDAGNISYIVPTALPYIKIGPDDLMPHTIEFREAAKSAIGNQAIITGAKALAATGYRLLADAELLHRVRKQFEKSLVEKAQ